MAIQILLLEDETQIREVVQEYLQMAGYEVKSVGDGNAAMEAVDQDTFDLAVLDIMVPGPSGLDVLARIRQVQPPMGIIMLSALNGEETQLEAFNQFADDYVTKPFSPIILLKRIATILRRRDAGPVKQPNFYCDEEAYQAFYQGASLQLTISEFLLLKALMDAPQRVFSREQLIDIIYQGDYFGSDRVIDSHMKNLRKKLPKPFIKTIIGIGYQFDGSML